MAEEKSHDEDDMTPDERVSWLRDRVSLNVLLLMRTISKDDDDSTHTLLLPYRTVPYRIASHRTVPYYMFRVDRASKWKHRKSDV
jgi:hypothetical protein